MVTPWKRPLFDIWVGYNRYLNKKYSGHVTKFVCNSENTRKRVEKYLGKDAIVINPPIDTSRFHYEPHKNYWLSVNRLITHKRVDIQIKAFSKMPNEKLIIVGSYELSKHFIQYKKYIESIQTPNVEIKHWVDCEDLIDLYARCKGLITTAMDEDFGMTPIEAMASGKPVIATNEGGYRETIVDGVTGKLIDDINEEKLIGAVTKVGENLEIYKNPCIEQAKKYDTNVFIKKIKEQIGI